MGANTRIEWATHTFSPWRGCTKVSDGCKLCYAETQSKRNLAVLGQWGPNGTRVVASEKTWRDPVRWNTAAKDCPNRTRIEPCHQWQDGVCLTCGATRPRIFTASMADVFEDWRGPMLNSHGKMLYRDLTHPGMWRTSRFKGAEPITMQDVRDRLFRMTGFTLNVDWLFLTKRPENIARMMPYDWSIQPRSNVWFGTSVEDQATADRRIPELTRVPARLRFLSMEPLLGPVDLSKWIGQRRVHNETEAILYGDGVPYNDGIGWVIIGGESGSGARPCYLDWVRDIIEQCNEAGCPVFVKQAGSVAIDCQGRGACNVDPADCRKPDGQCRLHLVDPKGGDMSEWPEDVRVRELPREGRG